MGERVQWRKDDLRKWHRPQERRGFRRCHKIWEGKSGRGWIPRGHQAPSCLCLWWSALVCTWSVKISTSSQNALEPPDEQKRVLSLLFWIDDGKNKLQKLSQMNSSQLCLWDAVWEEQGGEETVCVWGGGGFRADKWLQGRRIDHRIIGPLNRAHQDHEHRGGLSKFSCSSPLFHSLDK